MSLRLNDVTLQYSGRPVLDAVSLEARPGELLVLLGPNGAGKTSLMRLISGAMLAPSGSVDLDGTRLTALTPTALARRRAVFSQSQAVASEFTAGQVVMLGRTPFSGTESRSTSVRMANEALAVVGASAVADRPMRQLSGGEAQRVHLARALVQIWEPTPNGDARYLLLDEPVSALDVSWQHEAMDLLHRIARAGIGVFAILHDLNLASQYADRMALLHGGRIVADGPPHNVLTPDAIHRVYGICTTVCKHPTRACPLIIQHGTSSSAAGVA